MVSEGHSNACRVPMGAEGLGAAAHTPFDDVLSTKGTPCPLVRPPAFDSLSGPPRGGAVW